MGSAVCRSTFIHCSTWKSLRHPITLWCWPHQALTVPPLVSMETIKVTDVVRKPICKDTQPWIQQTSQVEITPAVPITGHRAVMNNCSSELGIPLSLQGSQLDREVPTYLRMYVYICAICLRYCTMQFACMYNSLSIPRSLSLNPSFLRECIYWCIVRRIEGQSHSNNLFPSPDYSSGEHLSCYVLTVVLFSQ